MMAQGFNEIVTYTMVSAKDLEKSQQAHLGGLKIRNPLW